MEFKVVSKYPVWTKVEPSYSSKNFLIVQPGELIYIDRESEDRNWIHSMSKGWVSKKGINGDLILQIADINRNILKVQVADGEVEEVQDESSNQLSDYLYDEDGKLVTDKTYEDKYNRKITVIKETDGTYTAVRADENGNTVYQSIDSNGSDVKSTTYYAKADGVAGTDYANAKNMKVENADGSATYQEWITVKDENGNDKVVVHEWSTDANGYTVEGSDTLKDPSEVPQNWSDEDVNEKLASIGMYKTSSPLGNLRVSQIRSIMGMPYQYMASVDRRMNENDTGYFGRRFAERIVAKAPLLIMSAGEPDFLGGWSKTDKESALSEIIQNASSDLAKNFSSIANRQGRYYTFKERRDKYLKYVMPILNRASYFLGIEDVALPFLEGKVLRNYSWDGWQDAEVSDKLNYKNSIAFYINSDTQIGDQFSNGTTKSQLADKVNQFSDMAKEINFLMGMSASTLGDNKAGKTAAAFADNSLFSNQQNSEQFIADALGGNNFLSTIATNISTITKGGKLIFPEIWSDSQYSKSYSITIKLRTNDCDDLSWFLNIFVPIAHLLPLVGPKMDGPNGYTAPFIVRAFYKGLFNCNMGIITDMSITRGEMGKWTMRGLPTSVDVTFTIKDLYEVMGISAVGDTALSIMNNIALLDYIANFCGININEPDIARMIKMSIYDKKDSMSMRIELGLEKSLEQYALNIANTLYQNRV